MGWACGGGGRQGVHTELWLKNVHLEERE